MKVCLFILTTLYISSIFALSSPVLLESRSPVTPSIQGKPTLERFHSAKGSFHDHSQPNSPTSSSPSSSPPRQRHEPIDPKNAAKVAQSYSRLYATAAVHSVAKGIAMAPVQACAGVYGCARVKVNRGLMKMKKDTTPQELEENKKLYQEQKKHLKRAPGKELKVGISNATKFFGLSKNEWRLGRKLRTDAKESSEGSSSRGSSLGQNSSSNNEIKHLTKDRYKAQKEKVIEHGVNQWDQSFRVAHMAVKGHDAEYVMVPGKKTEEDITKAKAGGSHSSP